MKIARLHFRSEGRRRTARRAGFTMTELALCIAIVAVAMIAIIGVLPSGLSVQKQNKEDTQVLEDGKFYLDTIRTGSSRMHDLTNYVDFIRLRRFREGNASGQPDVSIDYRCYWYNDVNGILKDPYVLITSDQILGLLSLPEITVLKNTLYTNVITAQMRPLGSSFLEQPFHIGGARPHPNQLDNAFRYLLTVQTTAVPLPPVPLVAGLSDMERQRRSRFAQERLARLHEIRMTAQWPVYPVKRNGTYELRTGNHRRTFRAQFNGLPDDKAVITNVVGSHIDVRSYATGSF